MSAKYIIRLGDACPTMNREKWDRIEQILDRYGIKPIVAVIPNNEDEKQKIDKYDSLFWDKVKKWQEKGWEIALHGYNHVYTTKNGGLIPQNKRSEFAGLPLEGQEEKIRKGIEIFRRQGIEPGIWVAPAHTFDENTLKALKKYTNIEIISDGIALNPYKKYGFTWIPQQYPSIQKWLNFGIWTVCLHPNTITEKTIQTITCGIEQMKKNIIKVSEIKKANKRLTLIDRLFNFYYWNKHRLVKIKNRITSCTVLKSSN